MSEPVVVCVQRGKGARNKLDHATLARPSWAAIGEAARDAGKAPQKAMWDALDPNLAEKSSRVKVAVQAMYVNSMCFRDDTLDEWKRLAGTIAVGALLLFRDGVEDRDAATYEPFEMVNGRSRVRSTKRRAKWERAVQAHGQLVASERFGGLTPEKLGGLFLLTHTPDHLPHEVEAFDLDFWMLRVMHLSLERNVDLRMNAFALTEARSRDADDDNGDAAAALRQLETIVALKVAIFYKKRHRDKEADPAQHALCVSRHDVEETKRKCLQRPHAPKPQRESVGVADYVRVAMNTTSLQQLVPVGEVLKRACEERTRLSARIHRLDQVACTHEAWQRAVAQQSAALQARLAQEHGRIAKAGGDAADMRHKYTADVVQRMASDAAKAELSTTGLRLQEEDSVWSIRNTNPAVHKLVAVGAGGGWRPRVLYVRTAQEQKDKFGTSGTSGFYGSAAIAKAARLEMHSLVERLLALLTLEFRLRESSAAATVLPVELHQGPLIVVDGAPCSKVPEHVEAYVRALRTQRTQAKHEETFATAVQRALVRAIKGAFFGCFEVVSFGNGCGPYDPAAWTHPRERASLAIMHRMLNIAARFNGLVAQDCEDEEAVPVVVYEREAETFHMADFLEHAVVHNWPAVRALADVAASCESWVRDFRKSPPAALCQPQNEGQSLWVSLGKGGLIINHAAKDATLAWLEQIDHGADTRWWEFWPPTREQVVTQERVTTAIAWGGNATAAFLGIARPDQFVGRAPFG